MKLQFDPVRNKVARMLNLALKELYPDQIHTEQSSGVNVFSEVSLYNQLVEPPNPSLGHLAFGVFLLSKTLKQAPPQVAQALSQVLKKNGAFASAEAAGPYLNIKLHAKDLFQLVVEPVLNGQSFELLMSKDIPKTMIEYSQPNTHKELHVGHMRNLCLGDSLVRLMKYCGFPIVTSTFPGDVGTHVAKCLWYLKFHNQEPVPQTKKGEWLGRIYSKAHLKLEDEVGTTQEEKNREQLTIILKQLESHSGEYYDQWKETRQWSIDLMKSVYKWADVEFDQWYWESDVDADSVKWIKELYKQGQLIESQGAIGMDLSADNLGFCMFLKSDGTGLYATKDLELARRKFVDHKIEKSIYVVDVRQALHFKQVFRCLEILGFPQAKNCFHLQYNFVELPDGAMSSRKGNIVPLTELIERMEKQIKDQFLSRYKAEWTQEEVDLVASQVAKGAIRYGMLRIDTQKKIVFDMNEWLRLDGESGPFIQYSAARISSLLRKFDWSSEGLNPNLLLHASEEQLIQHLMNFNTVVYQAAESYKPASLCGYLYDLAKKFNSFYHDCPIGTAENRELQQARLALAKATGNVLKKGLSLLGIPTPEKM